MTVNINEEGMISEIGIFNYQYPCPAFINFDNFDKFRCTNTSDVLKEDSWELINEEPNSQ